MKARLYRSQVPPAGRAAMGPRLLLAAFAVTPLVACNSLPALPSLNSFTPGPIFSGGQTLTHGYVFDEKVRRRDQAGLGRPGRAAEARTTHERVDGGQSDILLRVADHLSALSIPEAFNRRSTCLRRLFRQEIQGRAAGELGLAGRQGLRLHQPNDAFERHSSRASCDRSSTARRGSARSPSEAGGGAPKA